MPAWVIPWPPVAASNPYPYDEYMDIIGVDYRWRLNSSFSANGDSESNVGDGGIALIKRAIVSFSGSVSGITSGTADALCVSLPNSSGDCSFDAYVDINGTSAFTIGVWLAPASYSVSHGYFVLGTNARTDGTYSGARFAVTASGEVVLDFGREGFAAPSRRRTYISAAGAVPATTAKKFFAFYCAGGTSNPPTYVVYVNGSPVSLSYSSGTSSTMDWIGSGTKRASFGAGWDASQAEQFTGYMDDPFIHFSEITGAQIAELWARGSA